ncbi:MAG: peptidoglycan editing factor PgeF [Micavibrio sp.]
MKIYKDEQFSAACGHDMAYGFYGRQGGVSGGLYGSLNCGPGSHDVPEHVAQNRLIVARHLCGKDAALSTLHQCHSDTCLIVTEPFPPQHERPQGDALVTDRAGVPIGVLTADCGPVLFAGRKADGAPVIGAAHAGWGGALGGVLESTLQMMHALGALEDSIRACVGPCILQGSYEVSESFARPFLIKHEEAERFFMAGHKAGHLMFDLPGYIALRLAYAGVRQVSLTGIDTYTNEETLFSYRRATHRGEADYGRQISAIVIRS